MLQIEDSFAGFRSDFIHFSISLTSPLSLSLPSNSDSSENFAPIVEKEGYNSLHFSPIASSHFWRWWELFDGTLSLPIRQGRSFPSAKSPSKKFSKHCGTIKYRFSLSPLFISHTYRQESWSEWSKGETSFIGIKGKIGRFNVDLHQREEEEIIRRSNSTHIKKIVQKVFYQAEIDLDGVDLRVMSAVLSEPGKQQVALHHIGSNEIDDEDSTPEISQNTTVSDEDLEWIDIDDIKDAIYTLTDDNPRIKIVPFISCPRFTYYRHSDTRSNVPDSKQNEATIRLNPTLTENRKTKFGNEHTHTCTCGMAAGGF